MSTFEIVKVTTIIYDISKNINWNHRLLLSRQIQLLCTIMEYKAWAIR